MNINEIREQGIGSNFKVSNPADGYQKNNRLWFGECVECGERVTNSNLNGIWSHTLYSEKGYYSKEEFDRDGIANFTSSKDIDYCPKVVGETNETIRWYKVDGEKFFA